MKESSENYLETILVLEQKLGKVRSIDIVKETGFSKPSISIAMKKLKNSGHIDIVENGYIRLTDLGKREADYIYERHTVLVETLKSFGVSSEIAQEDACKIEHVISEETFAKLKEYVEKIKG